MHISFSQFEGTVLHFDPTKSDTEFAILVLEYIKRGSQDPVNKEVAQYFVERLTAEIGAIQ